VLRSLAIGLLAVAISFAAQAKDEPPYYAAIFGITVDSSGDLKAFRFIKVIDQTGGAPTSPNLQPPKEYIDAARKLAAQKKYVPRMVDGMPKEFFTWFFYVPSQPDRADLDPTISAK